MKEYTKKSMMRLGMLWVLRLSIVLSLMIPVGITLQICLDRECDLIGWAAYLGAIGLFMAPVLISKGIQKKYENEDKG